MGGGSSKNIAKTVTKAIANVSTKLIQQNTSSGSAFAGIIVRDTGGNVIISGNTVTSKIKINTKELLKGLVSQSAQQSLSAQIAQQAKSLVSGINLFNFSKAKNTVKLFMSASTDITTNITQLCLQNIDSQAEIIVDGTKGNVQVTDNTVQSVADIFSSCIENAVSKNSSIQKIQATIDQIASSKTKGFSIWALVIGLIVVLLFTVLPIILPLIFGVKSVINIFTSLLFPIMLVVGIVLVALYFTVKKTSMNLFGFSKLISNPNVSCTPVELTKSTSYTTAEEAGDACKSNKQCTAFDFQPMNVLNNGSATLITPPKTTLYSDIGNVELCTNSIKSKQDNLKIIRAPNLFIQETAPVSTDKPIIAPDPSLNTLMNGDIWIEANYGKLSVPRELSWYSYSDTEDIWNNKGALLTKDVSGVKLTASDSPPTTSLKPSKGDIHIQYPDNGAFITVFTANPDGSEDNWSQNRLSVPNYVPYIKGKNSATSVNTSGIKTSIKNTTLLIIGIALLVIGLIGTFANFLKKKKTVSSNTK